MVLQKLHVSIKSALCGTLAIFLLLVSAGCLRDPNVRKQKYLASGIQYFQKGDYASAAIQFQNALQIDKNLVPAHYQLALCFLRQNLVASAFRELSIAVDLDPKNGQAQLDLGNLLFDARRFTEARDRALLILKDDQKNVGAQLLLANSEARSGNEDSAVQDAQRAVQMAPDKPAPYLTLGLLQEKLRQLPEAEQSLQKAVSLDPKFLPAQLGLAGFYQRQHNLSQAEAEYRNAIQTDPASPVPPASLAALYLSFGKKDQAEQVLQAAKNAMPDNPAGYRMLGDLYVTTHDSAKALSEFASLAKEHPKDLEVKKVYLQLLIEDRQFGQALQVDEDMLKQNGKDADALLAKGQILNLENKPAEAQAVLEEALNVNRESAAAHSQLGNAYSLAEDSSNAEREWREAVKLKPSALDAQEHLAEAALLKGDLTQLQQSANAWVLYAPAAPQGYLMQGTAMLKKGDASAAEKSLRHALELDPKNSIACTRLGDLRVSQKRYLQAQQFYEQALAYNPAALEAMQGVVAAFIRQKQEAKALERVQEQVVKVPDNSGFYLLLGEVLVGNKKTDGAQSALEKAIALDSHNVGAYLLLARVQGATGQLDPAAATYDRSIRENPSDVRPYLALGAFEEQRDNWQHAQQLFQKVLQIQADQPIACSNLSFLLLEHGGDSNYALSLAQTARRGLPNSPDTADTLAWAYYKMGFYESAIPLLQEATRQAPQNAMYQYHLGLVYQKAEKPLLARASFQHALQINPKLKQADEIRQMLANLNTNP